MTWSSLTSVADVVAFMYMCSSSVFVLLSHILTFVSLFLNYLLLFLSSTKHLMFVYVHRKSLSRTRFPVVLCITYHYSLLGSNGTAACSQRKYFGTFGVTHHSLTPHGSRGFHPHTVYLENMLEMWQPPSTRCWQIGQLLLQKQSLSSHQRPGKYFMPSEHSLCIWCLLNLTTGAHRSQPQQTTACAAQIRDCRLDLCYSAQFKGLSG